MTITKNSAGYYEVRVKGANGKITRRSTGLSDRREASRWIRQSGLPQIELAARMGVLTDDVASILRTGSCAMTVQQSIDQYYQHMEYRRLSPRTIDANMIWIKAWATWADVLARPVSSLTAFDFDGWLNNPESKSKLSTRNIMHSALRNYCEFCSNSGWIQGNPAKLVQIDKSILTHQQKESPPRPNFTESEVNLMIGSTSCGGICEDYFWHKAIIIGRYTGLRISDICCLEWDSIDLGKNTITVWTMKRDKRVELYLEPDILRVALCSLVRGHERYVFNRYRVLYETNTGRPTINHEFSKITRMLGIPPEKTFHSLRGTYISDCAAKGKPMPHIARDVGHSSIETTAGYIRPLE